MHENKYFRNDLKFLFAVIEVSRVVLEKKSLAELLVFISLKSVGNAIDAPFT